MERKESHIYRSIALSTLGFGIGGVIGNLIMYLIINNGIVSWPLSIFPEEQNLVILVSAIVLTILAVAIATGAGGAMGGFALSIIDPIFPRRKYIWRTAIAIGIAEGLLILPLLLFTAVLSLYNNGLDRDPTGQIILFGVYGILFGIVFSLILGLSTVGWRQTWRVMLGSIVGFGLGGALIGYGLRITFDPYAASAQVGFPNVLVILPIFSLVFFAVGGLFLGIVYEWVSHWRVDNVTDKPARWVKVVGYIALLVVMYFLITNYRQLLKFVTINPGSLSSQISTATTGVHWDETDILAQDIFPRSEPVYDLSADSEGRASSVYTIGEIGDTEIVYSYQNLNDDGSLQSWSNPIPLSMELGSSLNPKISSDKLGANHIVWSTQTDAASGARDIFYSRCAADSCSPPMLISNLTGFSCDEWVGAELNSYNDWPVIVQDDENTTMVIWTNANNKLIYSIWETGQTPPNNPTGCLPGINIVGEPLNDLQARVSGGGAGEFSSIFSVLDADEEIIYSMEFGGGDWTEPRSLANGSTPNVFADREGKFIYAWCDVDSQVQVRFAEENLTKTIEFPPCNSRPYFAQDELGFLHISWYSDQIRNNVNVVSSAEIVYESVFTDMGWSEPAIVSQTNGWTNPILAGQGNGNLNIMWSDDAGRTLLTAVQPTYSCSRENLGRIGRLMLSTSESGNYRPEGEIIPYCDNSYIGLIYMPNPEPAFSPQSATTNGGFDKVSDLANSAQYEVLFSVMEWARDSEDTSLNPGSVYAEEIAKLYQQLQDDPSQYPRGLTIRILLGNYPELSNLEWGEQIWGAIDDLRAAGVDKMVDPDIGWKVEIANYEGTYPHSHTKFMIIDGKIAVASGYNYGYLHFPIDHPSKKGGDLFDLGIVLSGPIAQQALASYDDYWDGAEKVHCPELPPEPGMFWMQTCDHSIAEASHVPEVMKYRVDGGSANAFSLNRNIEYKESDEIILEALSSAQNSLDILEVNFSLELICMLDLLNDEVCSYENSLDYMKAIMTSVEENQAKVRVLIEKINSNGLENSVAVKEFTREVEERGLSELVDIRFFEGRLHAKAFLVDEEMLFVGSQNLHYSAWGEAGLAEYNLATDDPRAVDTFKRMFDFYWETGIPWDEYRFE